MAYSTPSPSRTSSNRTPMAELSVDDYDPKPEDDLICAICLLVLRQPVECSCQHTFCRECIEKWICMDNSCPVCRKRDISDFIPNLPLLQSRLNNLKVKCRNAGCAARVPADSYASHAGLCEFHDVGSLEEPRQRRIPPMAADTEGNSWVLVACENGCGLMFTAERLQSHSCLEELRHKLNEAEMERDVFQQNVEDVMEILEENCELLQTLQLRLGQS